MVGSASQNLVSFTDDPAIPFPPDDQGIIKTGDTDEFFGIVDTNNGDTLGRDVIATWVFDTNASGRRGISYTTGDTASCSCEQIIAALSLGFFCLPTASPGARGIPRT